MVEKVGGAATNIEDELKKLDTLDTNDSLNTSTVSSTATEEAAPENPADFSEEDMKKAEEYKA
jgi:hypothetical protein